MNAASIVSPIMIATAINALHAVRAEGPSAVFKVIVANTALAGGVLMIGQFMSPNLAKMLAFVYLVSVLLSTRESTVNAINWTSDLVEGL